MFAFGSGVLLGTRTDVAKELYGQYQFPVAIARGQGKATGKAKMAQVSGLAFNNLFFGGTLASGQLATAFGEAGTIPSSSAFTVTVVNSSTWQDDYGVVFAATGLPLSKVPSAPTAGQYSVAAGVYTFNSGDGGKAVLISYTYTVAGTGQQLTLTNPLMGTTPTFQAQLYTSFQGKPCNVKLFNCVSSKLAFATKTEDFVIPELDFDIFANAAGNVLQWAFGEVS
jgi:hypothetical protein